MLMIYIIVDKAGGIQEVPESFCTNKYSSWLFDGNKAPCLPLTSLAFMDTYFLQS